MFTGADSFHKHRPVDPGAPKALIVGAGLGGLAAAMRLGARGMVG